LALGCHSHSHEPSAELKKAFSIQQEALSIHQDVEKLIKQHGAESKYADKLKLWHENMVEIEGMAHDHKNCSHNHAPSNISVSDKEMIVVQQEWKDSIIVIKNQLQSL
jgi:hypothetical protein